MRLRWKDSQKAKWVRENPEAAKAMARRANLKYEYGITPEQYDQMLEAQGGVCAICKLPERERRQVRLCVDHDHVTGKVRGLLCRACNVALGKFQESVEVIRAALAYMERAA